MSYTGAMPGADVEYRTSNDAIGELIHLTGAGAPSRFVFDLRASAGIQAVKADNGVISFLRADGSEVSALSPSYAYAGSSGHPEQRVTSSLETVDGGWRLALTVDASWLAGALAKGSVTIDPTIEIQGTSTDCALEEEDPASSFCADPRLWVGWDGSHDNHSLVKWDLSAVPRDAVTLWNDVGLYLSNSPVAVSKTLTVHRVTRDWTNGASWNTYDATHPWTTPGGDYDPAPAATATVPAHTNGWTDWYPTALVQHWVDGSVPNYGLLVKDEDGPHVTGELDFLSTEGTTSATAPELDIVWVPRTGAADSYSFDTQALDAKTNAQVNIANGNLLLSTNDLTVPGTGGLDLRLDHYHNSLASPTDLQGVGIRGSASLGRDVHLHQYDPTTIGFFRGDGLTVSFTNPQTVGSTTQFDTPPELGDATLRQDTTSHLYTLHLPAGVPSLPNVDITMTFDSTGKLTTIKDPAGHAISLAYYTNGSGEFPGLNQITDTTGAIYPVLRDDQVDSYLQDIADPAGHHWHYVYGHQDTDYLITSTAGDGSVTHYDYDTSHRLKSITTPDGNVTLITYDGSSSRVASIVRTNNPAHTTGPTTTYSYSAPVAPCGAGDADKTVVTRPGAPAVTYCFDSSDMVTYDSSMPSDPDAAKHVVDDSDLLDESLGAGLDYDCDASTDDCTANDDPASLTAAPGAFGPLSIPTGSALWGLSDNNRATSYNAFQSRDGANTFGLGITYSRLVVPYDIALPGRDPQLLADDGQWLVNARNASSSMHVLISFEHCRGNAMDAQGSPVLDAQQAPIACENYRPTLAEYTAGVQAFMAYAAAAPRSVHPQDYTAWNEPNRMGIQPTATVATTGSPVNSDTSGAYAAARYWLTMRGICAAATPKCNVAAGDFLDTDLSRTTGDTRHYSTRYFQQYTAGMVPTGKTKPQRPVAWAYHPYSDAQATKAKIQQGQAPSFTRFRRFLQATATLNTTATDPNVWITEAGAFRTLADSNNNVIYQNSEACQEAILDALLTAPNINARTKRFYYYETMNAPPFDTGLLRMIKLTPRPAFFVYKAKTRPGYTYAGHGSC